MPETIEAPVEVDEPDLEELVGTDRPWLVIVWNDPVNLHDYVVFVFQKLFGYSREKATKLMLEVHRDGKSVVVARRRGRRPRWTSPASMPMGSGRRWSGTACNWSRPSARTGHASQSLGHRCKGRSELA